MGRCDIYHIYWGTAGNAGLYLDEIYQVLKKEGYSQKCFVNYYYPFDYGKKVFFKYTELGHCRVRRLRAYVRYLELLFALCRIFVNTIIDRPKIINYSLIGSFAAVRCYLFVAKKIVGSRIVLTCHDVIGSSSSLQGKESELKQRKKIFNVADNFLVHNDFSIAQLNSQFEIDKSLIVKHPFPIMDLSKLGDLSKSGVAHSDFLFIGHLRKEKGIDILLQAWNLFHHDYPDAMLRVAGHLPKMEQVNIDCYMNRDDIDFVFKFLSDEDYYTYIKCTRYVVLPYLTGTNSGVVSTAVSLHSDVIASNIPMFSENDLISKEYLFDYDYLSLYEVLRRAYNTTHDDMAKTNLCERILNYKSNFRKELPNVYQNLVLH